MELSDTPQQNVRDRMLLLRSLPTLANVEDEVFAVLAEHTRYRRYRTGTVILREGEQVQHVHLMVSGAVRVMRVGREYTVVRRPYGFGFLSVIARDDSGIEAHAIEDTVTLELPTSVLMDAYEEYFSFRREALRNSARSLLKARGNLPIRLADAESQPAKIGERPERQQTFVERVIQMRQGIFAERNLDAVVDLVRRTQLRTFPAGTMIWDIGDPPLFSARIEYGLIRCTNAEGQSVMVGSDFVLGALDPLSGEPRSYSAEAQTEVIAFCNDRENFLAVLETHHDLAMDMLAIFARGMLNQH